jgi:hypothetical protein
MKLSLLTIALGLVVSVLNLYGLLKPAACGTLARQFPRSQRAGWVLMLLGTAWFLYIVNYEPIADFSAYKNIMMLGFGAVGVLACVFVQDFLAVRGLAIVLMLIGKLMVDTGRPHLGESPCVLIIQTLAYGFVIAGMWLTITPWRLRDWLNWLTASETRVRFTSGVRLIFGLFLVGLGLTVFRNM